VLGHELRGTLEQGEAFLAECALPRLVAVTIEVAALSSTMLARSTSGASVRIPNRDEVRTTCATRARWMRNLLGTQPAFTQVLPHGSRYTSATLAPASTARLATRAPASPAPITRASVSIVGGTRGSFLGLTR